MDNKGKNSVTFQSICNMSNTQLTKLSKDQLTSALRDAIDNYNCGVEKTSRRSSLSSSPLTKDVFESSLGKKLQEFLLPIENRLVALLENQSMLQKKCELLQKEIDDLKQDRELSSANVITELEQRQNRKMNVIISGIEEKSEGSVDERKSTDQETAGELLRALNVDPCQLKSITRIGRPNVKVGKPRLLRITVQSLEAKLTLLKNAKSLKHTSNFKKVFVNKDLTPDQQRQQKAIRDELKKRKGNGEDVIIYRDEIVLRSDLKNFQ